jgi:hypothetical protein
MTTAWAQLDPSSPPQRICCESEFAGGAAGPDEVADVAHPAPIATASTSIARIDGSLLSPARLKSEPWRPPGGTERT